MTKVEAPTLEEAYKKASLALECSISELQCEVVQHPTKGILGFLKKDAIIVAACKTPKVKKEMKKEVISNLKKNVTAESVVTKDKKADLSNIDYKVSVKEDAIVDSFFEEKDKRYLKEDKSYDEKLAQKIEKELIEVFSHTCFNIDVIEVDVRDNAALIFIDGEDAALLIGKEGYRYNALSYMLFNWIHTKYELFIKLEIAEFLTSQQEMIRSYIKPVIETIEKNGYGKTRFLDGILVQIALEQLRERFPNKYVAVKTSKDGKKFVIINDFNTN